MRVLTTVNIDLIDCARKLPSNPKVLLYAYRMLLRDVFPPVKVHRKANGRYDLHDGRHRLAAHKLLGRKKINAYFGVRQDPYPYKDVQIASKPLLQLEAPKLELSATAKE